MVEPTPVETTCRNPRCKRKIRQPASYPVGARLYCDDTCGKNHARAQQRQAPDSDWEPWEDTTLADVRGPRRPGEFYNEGQRALARKAK